MSGGPRVVGRRELGVLAALMAQVACGPPRPSAPPVPPELARIPLDPLVDRFPAAGLSWVGILAPRTIFGHADLIPAVALLVTEERLAAFSRHNGGIDLRAVDELVVAAYGEHTRLQGVRVLLDPSAVEASFNRRAIVEGRAIDRPSPPIVRAWGDLGGQRQELAIFGRDAAVLEVGRPPGSGSPAASPLRAVVAFVEGRLKRAQPVLRGAAAGVARLIGEAPARAFVIGPFEGAWKGALGGLLEATTVVGAGAWLDGGTIRVRIALGGAWGPDAPAAAERLDAAMHVLRENALGRVTGVDRPVSTPRASFVPGALVWESGFDGLRIARGLHDALDAEIAEIMRH